MVQYRIALYYCNTRLTGATLHELSQRTKVYILAQLYMTSHTWCISEWQILLDYDYHL